MNGLNSEIESLLSCLAEEGEETPAVEDVLHISPEMMIHAGCKSAAVEALFKHTIRKSLKKQELTKVSSFIPFFFFFSSPPLWTAFVVGYSAWSDKLLMNEKKRVPLSYSSSSEHDVKSELKKSKRDKKKKTSVTRNNVALFYLVKTAAAASISNETFKLHFKEDELAALLSRAVNCLCPFCEEAPSIQNWAKTFHHMQNKHVNHYSEEEEALTLEFHSRLKVHKSEQPAVEVEGLAKKQQAALKAAAKEYGKRMEKKKNTTKK